MQPQLTFFPAMQLHTYRSLHCLPMRPLRWDAINDHLRAPWICTRWVTISSSCCVSTEHMNKRQNVHEKRNSVHERPLQRVIINKERYLHSKLMKIKELLVNWCRTWTVQGRNGQDVWKGPKVSLTKVQRGASETSTTNLLCPSTFHKIWTQHLGPALLTLHFCPGAQSYGNTPPVHITRMKSVD